MIQDKVAFFVLRVLARESLRFRQAVWIVRPEHYVIWSNKFRIAEPGKNFVGVLGVDANIVEGEGGNGRWRAGERGEREG